MKSVQVVVDNTQYTLNEISSGEWAITNKAPMAEGEYPVSVFATTDQGQTVEINVADPEMQNALTLFVQDIASNSGTRMLKYYPQVIQKILEFQALIYAEGFEIDDLYTNVGNAVNDAYLTTMGEGRINEWEKELGLAYSSEDSLEDRREAIIARIRGTGKLNTALINTIVNAFTGGTAVSYIKDSVLHVEINLPPDNKLYKFDNVVRELTVKKPAHLGLKVTRRYASWGDIKTNFADWTAVSQLDSWEDVLTYIPPQ